MTLHIGHRHADHQNEAREARRILKERVRDDWLWPVLPAHTETDSGRRRDRGRHEAQSEDSGDEENGEHEEHAKSFGGFKVHGSTGTTNGGELLYFEPVEWRERTYSSAESDVEIITGDVKKKFRFEAPESVGKQLSERATARKRRRQQAVVQEMDWNDGLAHWWRRRDAWCCAAPSNKQESTPSATIPSDTPSSQPGSNSETESVATDSTSSPRSSTSTTATTLTSSTTPTRPSSEEPTLAPTLDVLIPIAPRILPNHPVRTRISSSMYSEIYTKIILQSRTPSVPINLADLIAALVKGWKDDGEWPPKSTAIPETILGGKRTKKKDREDGGGEQRKDSPLKTSVKAFGRVLRLGT